MCCSRDLDKRWVPLEALMPRNELEETYAYDSIPPLILVPAKPVGVAFGCLYPRLKLGFTDKQTILQIRECVDVLSRSIDSKWTKLQFNQGREYVDCCLLPLVTGI
jgi:hypothetical protein